MDVHSIDMLQKLLIQNSFHLRFNNKYVGQSLQDT